MSKTNPNDQAFTIGNDQNHNGLTKREYFAAMAMQGMCADSKLDSPSGIVESAVKMADRLIRELNKE